jgi:hypothetical protein
MPTANGLNGAISILEMSKLDSQILYRRIIDLEKDSLHHKIGLSESDKEIKAITRYIKDCFSLRE